MGKRRKKNKLITKAKYLPIQDKLDRGVCLTQAAFALDVAVQKAIEKDDAEQIFNAAVGWMELSEKLAGIAAQQSAEVSVHDVTSEPVPFGFQAAVEEYEEEYDEE